MTSPSALLNNAAAVLTSPPVSSSTNATSAPNNELGADAFMTLLMAQLKSQDPLNPLNPTDMMNQLTQLNTLQELIRIREDIEKNPAVVSGGTQNSPQTPTPQPNTSQTNSSQTTIPAN